MGRFTAYDQNGRMVSDFDKSEYDFLRRYGRTPEEVLDENAKLREELEKWNRLAENIELPEYPVTEFHPKDLERENAKLRKELADAPKCDACEAMLDCDECLRADGSHKERRRLSAENSKLREQLEYALQTSRARLETIDRLKAENAKLREAVATAIKVQAVLCGDADSMYCRKECPLHRQESDDCLACDVIGVAQESGIEVDA